jgi:hypothetical protein
MQHDSETVVRGLALIVLFVVSAVAIAGGSGPKID